MKITLLICTLNPRQDYFTRTLEALRAQTLPLDSWEFLLVDNASKTPVRERFDLAWHPNGRHLSQPLPGKSKALALAFQEARGEVLVNVDDDNLLAPNYLEEAWAIHQRMPQLGIWGGTIVPEFERQPAPEAEPYLPHLALHTIQQDQWTNLLNSDLLVCGAGMCLTREVAQMYRQHLQDNKWAAALIRSEKDQAGSEDHDLCYLCYRAGLGCGLFPTLQMVHLMPERRVQISYLRELVLKNKTMAYHLKYRYGLLPANRRELWKARWRRLKSAVLGKGNTMSGLGARAKVAALRLILKEPPAPFPQVNRS